MKMGAARLGFLSRHHGSGGLTVRASDTFSYTALLDGHNLDNALGGSATLAWLNSFLQGASSNAQKAFGGYAKVNSGDYDQVAINTTGVLAQRSTVTCDQSQQGFSYPKLYVRWSAGAGEGYAYYVVAGGGGGAGSTLELGRQVNGSGTALATGSSWGDGDTISLEVDATNHLTVKKNGTTVLTFDDSGNSSVPAGTGGFGNHGTFTNFIWET